MDMLVVEGGRRLAGSVAVGGAKNAALPIMAAALAGNGPLTLNNVPNLVDVRTQAAVLHQLGVQIDWDGASTYRLEVVDDSPCVAPYELVRKMRASVCVLGPLLARRGKACVSLPGGCNIGFRPIDLHLKGLAALGADIRIEQGYVLAEARQLRGARVSLRGSFGSTVTGTCNVMTAATLARGVTIIDDAAREPEVVDLAECLQRMGAVVEGAGTQQIIVRGVSELSAAEHTVLPDRIEAATILCAGAITGGAVCVTGVRPHHLAAVLDALREAGADVQVDTDRVTISVPAGLRGVICSATPYPGIPTDVQAQITAVMTQASGVSHVADRVFPDRFMHLPELCRLGADIRRDGSTAVVHGPATLTGANLMACDLRASAALVLAALAATGESAVRRIYHLDRGYDGLESKLRQLGAVIRRENDTPAATPHLAASGSATDQCELIIPPPHFLSAGRPLPVPTSTAAARHTSSE